MFGREDLDKWEAVDTEGDNDFGTFPHIDVYTAIDADKVMDAMERRIKRQSNVIKKLHEILDGNWEFWQKSNAELEQTFTKICAKRNSRIKELEDNQLKWISVKDRLPKLYEMVVVHNPNNENALYKENVVRWHNEYANGPITHWMPLPESPKLKSKIKELENDK